MRPVLGNWLNLFKSARTITAKAKASHKLSPLCQQLFRRPLDRGGIGIAPYRTIALANCSASAPTSVVQAYIERALIRLWRLAVPIGMPNLSPSWPTLPPATGKQKWFETNRIEILEARTRLGDGDERRAIRFEYS
ncbi:uncharacterized protein DMAD_02658 [Drosophila madeirensis]|uniref:Uncharacterized protein n=1 Tax=Drosophila madeirensis TaxID=30013 RepID=A0AAU9G731_DROMD